MNDVTGKRLPWIRTAPDVITCVIGEWQEVAETGSALESLDVEYVIIKRFKASMLEHDTFLQEWTIAVTLPSTGEENHESYNS